MRELSLLSESEDDRRDKTSVSARTSFRLTLDSGAVTRGKPSMNSVNLEVVILQDFGATEEVEASAKGRHTR